MAKYSRGLVSWNIFRKHITNQECFGEINKLSHIFGLEVSTGGFHLENTTGGRGGTIRVELLLVPLVHWPVTPPLLPG